MVIIDTLLNPSGQVATNVPIQVTALSQSGSIPEGARVEHNTDSSGYVTFPLLQGHFKIEVMFDKENWHKLGEVMIDADNGTLTLDELIEQYGV